LQWILIIADISHILQAAFSTADGTFDVLLKLDSAQCSGGSSPSTLGAIEVAIVTVMLDADQQPLNETFYPYYGSTSKQAYVPTPQATFQSTFQPYTVLALAPPAPGFAAGYPTASSITSNSFVLQAHLNQTVGEVAFAVLKSSVAATILPSSANSSTLAAFFDQLVTTYADTVVDSGQASIAARAGASLPAHYEATISTGPSQNGGTFTVVVQAKAGCSTLHALLQNITLPDTEAPSFLSVDIDSPCESLITGTDVASLPVRLTLSEPAKVRCQL
jgi:hypothetical protein